jgi:uncharacterized protein YgiM (DUF1202 family)
VKYLFSSIIFLLFIISACSPQADITPTQSTGFVVRELPTTTPTTPPTVTPVPTNTPTPTSTPVPPTPTFTSTPTITPTITPTPECVGASPTRLSVGGRAIVINFQLNVRSNPGTQYSLINRLAINRKVTIVDGPQCNDGQLWYHIVSDDFTNSAGTQVQVEGWSVEESGGAYFLGPID